MKFGALSLSPVSGVRQPEWSGGACQDGICVSVRLWSAMGGYEACVFIDLHHHAGSPIVRMGHVHGRTEEAALALAMAEVEGVILALALLRGEAK